jgi:uracil-DNA glycosylase family 4
VSELEKNRKLAGLYERLRKDPGYRNEKMGNVFVLGRGALRDGATVLVGEAPGRNEEKLGFPFAGAAGRNLDMLLVEAGLSRGDIFITNLIKYRPITPTGANRTPSLSESRYALPFLVEELEILKPGLVVCLGLSAARVLIGNGLKMEEANGVILDRFEMKMLATYHPSPFNYMMTKKREAMVRVFRGLRSLGF